LQSYCRKTVFYTIERAFMDESKTFQVSVKGLCFDETGRLLMVRENTGEWELPGGRLERGEELRACLQREIMEEMGLVCQILDEKPYITYSTIDQEGRGRIMIYYRVHFASLQFIPSEECVAVQFYTKEEMKQLPMVPQIKNIIEYL
jgi:8-oxo-dGTP diphosphatase